MLKIFNTFNILLIVFGAQLAFSDNTIDSQEYFVPIGPFSSGLQVRVRAEDSLRHRNITIQKYDYSCGSAALTTILNLNFELNLNEAEVIEGLITFGETEKIIRGRRFSLLDMKRYLEVLGIDGAGYKATINDVYDIPFPAVISIDIEEFKHFVVLMGVEDDHVIIADPAFGHMSVTIPKFDKVWTNKIFFTLNDKKSKDNKVNSLDETLLRYVSEGSYYNSVLRNNVDLPVQTKLRSQRHSLITSGALGSMFK